MLVMKKKIEKQSTRTQPSQKLSGLWLCFLMFVVGYLSASFFDFNQVVNLLRNRLGTHPLVENGNQYQPSDRPPVEEQHPTLEFYTLLTNKADLQMVSSTKVNKTEPRSAHVLPQHPPAQPMELSVTAPAATLPAPASGSLSLEAQSRSHVASDLELSKVRYGIQVGSFRSETEAKRMRDKLRLRGYPVMITRITQESIDWYRVIVGPVATLTQSQQLQSSLERSDHIKGMIHKLEGSM